MVFKAVATSGNDPGVDGGPDPECRTWYFLVGLSTLISIRSTFIMGMFQFVSASCTSAWLTSFSPTLPNLIAKEKIFSVAYMASVPPLSQSKPAQRVAKENGRNVRGARKA